MGEIPGSSGYSLFGDKSYEFYKNPVEFAERRIKKHDSRIFLSRLLNKPTIFVCSYDGVKEILTECAPSLELGYKALWYDLFGDSIIFYESTQAAEMKEVLRTVFTGVTYEGMCSKVDHHTKNMIDLIQPGAKIDIYPYMKRFATDLCLALFLGIDPINAPELSAKLTGLSIAHWHGIISVPLQVKGPLLGSSSYAKAMNAKAELLALIAENLPQAALHFPSESAAVNHLLLFSCALIPKALASLLTSFFLASCRQTAYQQNGDDALLCAAVLEVVRMWPPFVGGRRLITKTASFGGTQLLPGQAVLYHSHMAHRDPGRFVDPEEFLPERWLKELGSRDPVAILKEDLFTLGFGPRQCCGHALIWKILKGLCDELIKQFTWRAVDCDVNNMKYKHLPVARPASQFFVQFTRKESSQTERNEASVS